MNFPTRYTCADEGHARKCFQCNFSVSWIQNFPETKTNTAAVCMEQNTWAYRLGRICLSRRWQPERSHGVLILWARTQYGHSALVSGECCWQRSLLRKSTHLTLEAPVRQRPSLEKTAATKSHTHDPQNNWCFFKFRSSAKLLSTSRDSLEQTLHQRLFVILHYLPKKQHDPKSANMAAIAAASVLPLSLVPQRRACTCLGSQPVALCL